jgi:hypothetical protein
MGEMGAPNPGNGTYASWYYNGANVPDRSYSWTSAHWFRYHWANVNNSGYNRAYRYQVYTVNSALQNWNTIWYDLWEGDIVQHIDATGNTYHSKVIHDYDIPAKILYYAQHTSNKSFQSLYSYLKMRQDSGQGNEWFVTIQIKNGA